MEGGSEGYSLRYSRNAFQIFTAKFGKGAAGFGFSAWWRVVAERHLEIAKEEAPSGNKAFGTGLRESHFLRILNQYAIEIGSDAYYAPYVHWGTQPHWMPRYLLREKLVNERIYYGIAARGAQPNPWMVRAEARLEAELPRMMDEFFRKVQAEMQLGSSAPLE